MRLISGLVLMALLLGGRLKGDDNFDVKTEVFIKEYQTLELSPLQLSYVSNLESIRPLREVLEQEAFFLKQRSIFGRQEKTTLNPAQAVDLDFLNYEIDLNLERIALEKKWLEAAPGIKGSGLAREAFGKQWYGYFLKRWVDKDLTPEKAYSFGLGAIGTISRKLDAWRLEHGVNRNSTESFLAAQKAGIGESEEVNIAYEQVRSKVRSEAVKYFPKVEQVPEVIITRGTNPAMARVPGYYTDNTFYYNFFDEEYDGGSTHWLFLHEALPGHHYQAHLRELFGKSRFREHFRSYCFIEGWGAYVEQLGGLLGLYDTPATEYAMLEWDLIRSVRVAMDVGLNYYEWSDAEALEFWKHYIFGKDEVGKREIERMKQWPAQVITYKYGESVLNELRGGIPEKELMAFHTEVLTYGDVPLSILRTHLKLKG